MNTDPQIVHLGPYLKQRLSDMRYLAEGLETLAILARQEKRQTAQALILSHVKKIRADIQSLSGNS